MATKTAHQAARRKAAKEKKILLVLSLPLVVAVFYAYHTMTKLNGSSASPSTPAAATAPASTVASATPAATRAATPAVTPAVVIPTGGTLSSFTGFARKDPFDDGGPRVAAPTATQQAKKQQKKAKKQHKAKTQPAAPLTGAVISVNGSKLGVALGTDFGHAPGFSGVSLFRLVRLTRQTATIQIVGTTQRFTLRVKHPLTLRQQAGGWTYTLVLYRQGTAAPMSAAPTAPTTATTSTPGG